jgi:hypothetical protein
MYIFEEANNDPDSQENVTQIRAFVNKPKNKNYSKNENEKDKEKVNEKKENENVTNSAWK